VENQNPARNERLCRGHLPALTKRQLSLPACSGGAGDALVESKTSLGREKRPAKRILPLVSIKQGGISQEGGGFSPFLGGRLGDPPVQPAEKQERDGGREGNVSGKVNSHPLGRDNSHRGRSPSCPSRAGCVGGEQHGWDEGHLRLFVPIPWAPRAFLIPSAPLAAAEAGALPSAARFDCSSCGFGAYVPAFMHGSIC